MSKTVSVTVKPTVHSRAPWSIWTSNSYRRICDADGREIIYGSVQRSDGHPDLTFHNGGEEGPDAKLVIAAPEMAEALRMLVCLIDTEKYPQAFNKATAVLAKAGL